MGSRALVWCLVLVVSGCGGDPAPAAGADPFDAETPRGDVRRSPDPRPDDDTPDADDPDVDDPETPATPEPASTCLLTDPATVHFGARSVGLLASLPLRLYNCGDATVAVTRIALDPERSSADFALAGVDAPPFTRGARVSPETPLRIPAGGSASLSVRYAPSGLAGCPSHREVEHDEGVIVIETVGQPDVWEVPVDGAGYDISDSIAIIALQEAPEVSPGTTLHLFGDQSFFPSGPAVQWEWSVEQPVGGQSLFSPSPTATNPTFTAHVVGPYLFRLTTMDTCGHPSFTAEAEVTVTSPPGLHVELLWNTPGDPDQTDVGRESGADLDLHFARTRSAGPGSESAPWFDRRRDCWAANPHPEWGALGASDDPLLGRSDADGAGPETVTLSAPAEGSIYRLAAQYVDAHGFGPTWATVRIHLDGALVFERADVKLAAGDLWEVATVEGSAGVAWPVRGPAGGPMITAGRSDR